MKLITFLIPCYNGEKYLQKAVESIVPGGDDVEIIIINDGSKDNSLQLAKSLQKKYPKIINVVDKENGGHGSGINKGIELGTGLYFKVVDCDDWINPDGYQKLLETIKKNIKEALFPDIYFMKFYYDRFDENYKYAMPLEKDFPSDTMFSWNKVKLKYTDPLMLHALTFRLDLLKDNHIHLLEKCFYEDNELVYKAMVHAQTFYFLNDVFYHYYIGRQDQSVSTLSMQKHYHDYLRVFEETFKYISFDKIKKSGKSHHHQIIRELVVPFMLAFMAIFRYQTKEKKKEYRTLMKSLKRHDKALYKELLYKTPVFFVRIVPVPIRHPFISIATRIFNRKLKWVQ